MSEHKDIAILYHGGCPDGFGGAYAAWKKFGDSAEYIPLQHGKPAPEHLEGKDLYFIDFCYPEPIMVELEKVGKSITVLDHHEGARSVATTFPGIFDTKRSGATIAWSYFHPEIPTPLLLEYVEDGDLYVFKLPSSRAMLAYMYAQPFHFETWDTLREQLESDTARATILERGKTYAEHFHILVEQIAQKATLVSFEGYECYLATAPHMFVSDVGNHLANMRPPLALITSFRGDTLTVSLRSDPSVDVSAIARKYGGNGHPQAAAFRLNWGDPLPWTVVKEHEDSRG
jgi:hypothetical protein